MIGLGSYAAYWGVRRAQHEAVVFEDQRLTWAEFFQRTEAVAAAFQELGVKPGDRVGVLLPNGVEWPVAYLAIWRVGAIVVPLNVKFGRYELRAIESDSDCRLLVSCGEAGTPLKDRFKIDPADDRVVLAPRAESPLSSLGWDEVLAANGKPNPHKARDEEVAAVFYTSGTTGVPKGTIHTHGSIQSGLLGLNLACNFTYKDRGLLMAPLAFTGMALGSIVPLLMSGGCVVIERGVVPERLGALIERERITYIMVVPAIWERLARSPDFEHLDLSSIRLAGTGGAPIVPELMEAFRRKGVIIQQTYGSTEGGCLISIHTRERALEEPTSCGLPLVSVTMRVVDDEGNDVPPGALGEFLLSGPQIMQGYWQKPEETAEAFVDGWYRTGDLGCIDADGSVTILDRKKNMIISGGLNIYPAEIEMALMSIPCVGESAVFGIPDDTWGERAVALVHLASPATRDQIYAAARELLGPLKAPKDIVIVPDPLPRTVTNKVARPELPALYAAVMKSGAAVA